MHEFERMVRQKQELNVSASSFWIHVSGSLGRASWPTSQATNPVDGRMRLPEQICYHIISGCAASQNRGVADAFFFRGLRKRQVAFPELPKQVKHILSVPLCPRLLVCSRTNWHLLPYSTQRAKLRSAAPLGGVFSLRQKTDTARR